MGALLARLNDDARRALTTASIFDGALDRAMLAHCGADETVTARWHNLSLVQREADAPDDTARYSLHPVVREFLLGRLSDEERRRLHLHAASFYQERIVAPFRDRLPPELWKNDRMAATGVLGALVQQTQNMDLAREAMELGIAWRAHLFAARWYEQAEFVTEHIWQVLDQWGQRDLIKRLLHEGIATLVGENKAVAQGNLASLLMDEGRLDKALTTYEEVYRTFETLGRKQQMMAVLNQQSIIYHMLGQYDNGVETCERSLKISQELGDEESQARSLHQLSNFHTSRGDLATALSRSQEAEALSRKLGNEHLVAATLHAQGLVLNEMNRSQEAFARFQESLAIKQRTGDQAGIADSLAEMGKLLLDAEQIREAIMAFNQCLEIYHRQDNPAKMGIILELLGRVHEQQGQYAAALEKYEEALRLARQYWAPQDVAIVEQDIARVKGKMSSG